ncbi:MAG: hypothetical protein K2I49_03010 [Ureaplasma sp.]|nr:hypothetical protein [Ureaplasma sp.]
MNKKNKILAISLSCAAIAIVPTIATCVTLLNKTEIKSESNIINGSDSILDDKLSGSSQNGGSALQKEQLKQVLANNLTSGNLDSKITFDEFSFRTSNNENLHFNISDLKDTSNWNNTNNAYKLINDFVENNSKSFLKQQTSLYKHKYYKDSDLSINNIIREYEPDYITIDPSKPNSYIVDSTDEFDLYGPYYLQTSENNIKKLQNKSNWQPINYAYNENVELTLNNELISNFFNLLINSFSTGEKSSNSTINYNTIYEFEDDDRLQTKVSNYFQELENLNKVGFDELIQIYKTMKNGKKYNEFLKTPVLFYKTMSLIVNDGMNNKFLEKTRDVYSSICEYYNKKLYSTVPKEFLNNVNGSNQVFSFTDLFQINNNAIDLNYNLEELVNNIRNDYPGILEFAKFFTNTQLLLTKFNTLYGIEFNPEIYVNLFNINLSKEYYSYYETIWNVLNSVEEQDFLNNIIELNKSLYRANNNEIQELLVSDNYYNNFISIRKTYQINKMILDYWLFKDESKIKEWEKYLTADQQKLVKQLSSPTFNNSMFNAAESFLVAIPRVDANGETIKDTQGNIMYEHKRFPTKFVKGKEYFKKILETSTLSEQEEAAFISRMMIYLKELADNDRWCYEVYKRGGSLDILTKNDSFKPPFSYIDNLNSYLINHFKNRFLTNEIINNTTGIKKIEDSIFLLFTRTNLTVGITPDIEFETILKDDKDELIEFNTKSFAAFKLLFKKAMHIYKSISLTKSFIKTSSSIIIQIATKNLSVESIVKNYMLLHKFAFDLISLITPWVAVLSILLDVAMNLHKTKPCAAAITLEESNTRHTYIWTGAERHSWFYGLVDGDLTSESISKLNLTVSKPVIKINNENNNTFLFYDGKRYNKFLEKDKLIVDQVNDIRNGNYNSAKLQKVYSLVNLINPSIGDSHFINMVSTDKEELKYQLAKYISNINFISSKFKIYNNKFIKPKSFTVSDFEIGNYKFKPIKYDLEKSLDENLEIIANNILNNKGVKYE